VQEARHGRILELQAQREPGYGPLLATRFTFAPRVSRRPGWGFWETTLSPRRHSDRRSSAPYHPRSATATRPAHSPHDPADQQSHRPPRATRIPCFCAVPSGTPIQPIFGLLEADPTAGPYYLSAAIGGAIAVLSRHARIPGGTSLSDEQARPRSCAPPHVRASRHRVPPCLQLSALRPVDKTHPRRTRTDRHTHFIHHYADPFARASRTGAPRGLAARDQLPSLRRVAALATETVPQFFSERIGCKLFQRGQRMLSAPAKAQCGDVHPENRRVPRRSQLNAVE
jgi:hypothetical protein